MIHLCFYKPHVRIFKRECVCDQIALASRLCINWRTSRLISSTKRDLECLGWQRSVVQKGSIFLHLGYTVRLNTKNAQLMEWMISK